MFGEWGFLQHGAANEAMDSRSNWMLQKVTPLSTLSFVPAACFVTVTSNTQPDKVCSSWTE